MLFSAIRIQLCKRKRWIQACWENMQNDRFTSEVTLPQSSFKWILLILNHLLWLPAIAPLLFSSGYRSGLWDTLWEVRPCSINKTSSENEGVNTLSHIGRDEGLLSPKTCLTLPLFHQTLSIIDAFCITSHWKGVAFSPLIRLDHAASSVWIKHAVIAACRRSVFWISVAVEHQLCLCVLVSPNLKVTQSTLVASCH